MILIQFVFNLLMGHFESKRRIHYKFQMMLCIEGASSQGLDVFLADPAKMELEVLVGKIPEGGGQHPYW